MCLKTNSSLAVAVVLHGRMAGSARLTMAGDYPLLTKLSSWAHPQLISLFMRGKVQVTHPRAVSGPHQALTLHPVTSASVG